MPFHHKVLFLLILLISCQILLAAPKTMGQSHVIEIHPTEKRPASWEWIEPETWFTVRVPPGKYEITDAADSNSRTYFGDGFRLSYIYWFHGNTPHFIQWMRDHPEQMRKDPQRVMLSQRKIRVGRFTGKLKKYLIRTDGKAEYLIEIHFPNTTVAETGMKGSGEFKFSVTYANPKEGLLAQRIIKSLKFL